MEPIGASPSPVNALLLTGTQNVRYSRRVLEYSIRYSPSTRVANYSDSTALIKYLQWSILWSSYNIKAEADKLSYITGCTTKSHRTWSVLVITRVFVKIGVMVVKVEELYFMLEMMCLVPGFPTWKTQILKYCGYSIANHLCLEYCLTYLLEVFTTHLRLNILTLYPTYWTVLMQCLNSTLGLAFC